MNRKFKLTALLLLLLSMVFTPSVLAFSDMKGEPEAGKIEELRKAGIISGIDDERFAPRASLTYAQGVQLIVRGLNLNIDSLRFIKEPQASDYFSGMPNDAWYAEAFIIAHLNGLDIPQDVDPAVKMTREQYAHLLMQAVRHTVDFSTIEIFIMISDEADISPAYMNSIQILLNTKMAALDKDKAFHPKDAVTRIDAALMMHAAVQFVREHKKHEQPSSDQTVSMTVEKVTDQVNKVTISWGMKPHPGYRVTIDRIEFQGSGQAVIGYTLHQPEPNVMYPQVITEAKASTYVDSKYKPIAEGNGKHIDSPK